MLNTTNYKLKKPEPSDAVDINDFNYNADVIDKTMKELDDEKLSRIEGKQLSTEDYTTEEKQKLAEIEKGSNKYIHPNNSSTRHVSDSEKSKWNNAVSKSGDTMTGPLKIRTLASIYGESTGISNIAYAQFLERDKVTSQGGIGYLSSTSPNMIFLNNLNGGFSFQSSNNNKTFLFMVIKYGIVEIREVVQD